MSNPVKFSEIVYVDNNSEIEVYYIMGCYSALYYGTYDNFAEAQNIVTTSNNLRLSDIAEKHYKLALEAALRGDADNMIAETKVAEIYNNVVCQNAARMAKK